ncbi:uncharacterized protein [Narcine bancroftii]|uniref:uncharacterized protein n=1 Tax=Narcine bancroftii TaxID=1343680 RepID=UPI003831AD63
MESGYYSEMESLESAPADAPDAGSCGQGLLQRSRPGRGRSSSSSRRKREFISDEKKDASYWEKRRKNNEAAKRSREKRRISDMVLESRVLALNQENVRLRSELLALKLRFGLITTAAYVENSQQLAGAVMGSFYATCSPVLLQSDSSEAEHSGFPCRSKFSPRGSLSDASNGSLSAGNSPEPVVQGDARQDDHPADGDALLNVHFTYGAADPICLLRSCDDGEFLGYRVKCSLAAGDIAPYRAPGGGEPAASAPGSAQAPAVEPPPPVQGPRRAPLPAVPSALAPPCGVERPAREPGCCRLGAGALGSAAELSAAERPEGPSARPCLGRKAATRRVEPQGAEATLPCPPSQQDALGRCPPPCSGIEAPRGSDQGALPEGPGSGSRGKCDAKGSDAAALPDPHQRLKGTALPHKLRLKVRAMHSGEHDNGQDPSPRSRERGPRCNGCAVRSRASVHGKGALWGESGSLGAGPGQCHVSESNHLSDSTPSKHRTAIVSYCNALERNTTQCTETLPLHDRGRLTSPTRGESLEEHGCREMKQGQGFV